MSKTIITIIQEIDSNKVIVECALCRGSGQRPGYTSDTPCTVCNGKGVVLVKCTPPLVKCSLCNGSGHRPGYTSDTPCKACGGIGGQPLTGEFEILG